MSILGATQKQPHTFIFEGEIKHESVLPEISRTYYISLGEVAKIYNLSYSFKAISGKAVLRAYNRGIEFTINSDRYRYYDSQKSQRLKNPARLIKNKLYIPLDFLTSKDFSSLTETETLYYPENRTFIISVKTNISSPRFYSLQGESTRIIIEPQDKENPPRPATKISGGKLILEYPRGKVLEESISVQDGVVREIRLSNARGGRTAVVEIFLTENARPKPLVNIKDDGTAEIIVERAELPIAATTASSSFATNIAIDTTTSSPTAISVGRAGGEVEISSPDTTITVGATTYPSVSETPLDSSYMRPSKTQTSQQTPQAVVTGDKSQKTSQSQTIRAPKIKIVLDAGHGGEDPGAIGPNGTLEKDINLAIVGELEKIFASSDDADKFEILLTRTDDTFVPLVDRTNFANEKAADIFVSVHCNASMKKTTGGYEVYFLSENASDPEAIATQILENSVVELEKKSDKKRTKLQELLWSMIVNEFINESSELCHFTTVEIPKRIKVENRGVRQAGFYVLRGAQMPAILVECAFLSNPAEEAKLKNPRIQKQIADGLYTAIKNYLKSKGKI